MNQGTQGYRSTKKQRVENLVRLSLLRGFTHPEAYQFLVATSAQYSWMEIHGSMVNLQVAACSSAIFSVPVLFLFTGFTVSLYSITVYLYLCLQYSRKMFNKMNNIYYYTNKFPSY
jgi:hypothetical protein